jgi:hypothetical protein
MCREIPAAVVGVPTDHSLKTKATILNAPIVSYGFSFQMHVPGNAYVTGISFTILIVSVLTVHTRINKSITFSL